MKKTLCFTLDNASLYLDKVLVSFNDTPIFYTCLDQNSNYYLVLCTDLDNFNYIVISIKLNELYNMLINKIDMRTPFVNATHFWEIKTGANPKTDEVQLFERNSLDISFLPVVGAMYNPILTEDEEYVKNIELNYLSNCQFEEKVELKLNTQKIESSDETPSLSDLGSNCWNLCKEVEIQGNSLSQAEFFSSDSDEKSNRCTRILSQENFDIDNMKMSKKYSPKSPSELDAA